MNLRVLPLLLLPLVSSFATAQTASPSEKIVVGMVLKPEFDRVLRDYEKAWAAGDVDAVAALFATSGYALPNGAPPASGAEQIRDAYRKHAGSPLFLRALADQESGDLAYIVGGFAFARQQPDVGKFVLVLGRGAGGRWVVLADIDNMDAPPKAPAKDK